MSLLDQAYEEAVGRKKTRSFVDQAFHEAVTKKPSAPVAQAEKPGDRTRRSSGVSGSFQLPGDKPPASEKIAKALTWSPARWLAHAAGVPETQFEKSLRGGTERLLGAAVGTAGSAPRWGPDVLLSQSPAGRAIKGPVKALIPEKENAMERAAGAISRHAERPELARQPGVWNYIQDVTGQTLPLMAGALAAGAATGPIGAFAVGFAGEGEQAYQEARVKGASTEQANTERVLVGSLNGLIEMLQVNGFLKLGKDGVKPLVAAVKQRAWRKAAQAGGKLAGQDLANAASEGLEETLQEAVNIGAATIHDDAIEVSDWKRLAEAAVGGFTAGAILGAPSTLQGGPNIEKAPQSLQEARTAQTGPDVPPALVTTVEAKPGALPTKPEVGSTATEASQQYQPPNVTGVALLLDDGTIIKGQGKNAHFQIVGELPEDRNVVDAGFLDAEDNYLYRDDVLNTPALHALRPTSPTVVEKETPEAAAHTAEVESPTTVRLAETAESRQGREAVSPPDEIVPPTEVPGEESQQPGQTPPPESVGPQGPALPPVEPPVPVTPAPRQPPQGPAPTAPGKGSVKAKGQSIYQDLINRFASLEDLSKRAKALGLKIKPGEDPGMRARSYLGVGNKVQSTLEDATFRTTPEGKIEKTGEGYKPILDDFDKAVATMEASAKQRARDLQDYEVSQRTILDLQRPVHEGTERQIVTPAQVATAQKKLAALQAKYGKALATFEDIFKRRVEYRARILHLLVDSGNLSQEQYDKIVAENPHYVPFDRVMDEVETSAMPRAKKPFTQARSPVRKIKGSQRDVENATESDIKNTYRIMDTAERNTVARSVAKLADSFPEDISPVHVKMVPVKVHPEEIETVRREFRTKVGPIIEEVRTGGGAAAGTTAPTAGPMAKLETVVREALIQRGMTEGEAGNYIRKLRGSGGQGPTTVETIERTVKEAEQIVVSEEPVESTIFRPSQFAPKGKVIEYFQEGKRKYIEVTDNLYSAMTGLNEASLGMLTKIMATPANLLRKGATLTPEFIVRNPIRDQWTAMMNTQVGFIPFLDTARAVFDVVGKSEAYQDWLRSGGSHSGFVELSRPNLRKAVKELTRPSSWKLLSKLNIVSDLRYLSQLMEQATRVGVYKRAVAAGQTPIEAGYTSREGTTDFARRGSKTKDINAMVAFFNAGVQGLDRSIRAAKADPIGFTVKGITTLTLPSLLLYLRNRKEDDWEEIPRWQRDLFWCFKVGDRWYRIPKPFLFGQIFGSVPERVAEYIDRKDPQAFDELAASLYDSLSPVSGDPAGGLLPTAIRPIIENATNWNFFRDRPVVGESRQDLLPPYQHNRYTTETAKELGKLFDYSPAKIENLVQGWFGGSGQYALEGGDVLLDAIRAAQGEPVPGRRPSDPADLPLVKGFAVRPPEAGQAESIRKFYDESATLTAQYSTWRRLAIEGDVKGAETIFARNPELLFATETNRNRDDITEHGKEIDRISASTTLSAAQKREMIRAVEKKRMVAVKEANTEIARLKSDPAAVLTALTALRSRSVYKTAGQTIRGGKPVGYHKPGQAQPGLESLVAAVDAEIARRQGGSREVARR